MNRIPTLILPAVAAAALAGPPADAALLFYEDFEGLTASASLDGQGGWSSPGNSQGVRNGPFDGWNGTIGNSATAGGNFIANGGTHAFGSIALTPFVTNSFAAGTTTWFSYVEYNGSNGSAGRQNVALGAAPLTGNGGTAMAGDGLGVGTTTGNTPRAAYWDNATGENADAGSTIGSGRPIFVVAKIDWSDAGNDTITVKRWNQTTGIPVGLTEADWNAVTEQSTISADLDQSTFDTLSFANQWAYLDDIRIASDFDSAVTGTTVVIPEPTSLTLLGLGTLLVTRRRR